MLIAQSPENISGLLPLPSKTLTEILRHAQDDNYRRMRMVDSVISWRLAVEIS
jgi:hypothetical protein